MLICIRYEVKDISQTGVYLLVETGGAFNQLWPAKGKPQRIYLLPWQAVS